MLLALSFVGPLVAVAAVLVIVFAMIRRAIDRAADALTPEGIELDSGPVTVTTRLRNYRAPGFYSGGAYRRNPARVVLTKQRLYILQRPQRFGVIDRADLAAFTIGILDGKLQLRSDKPPGATGSIDFRIPVRDPDAWVARLASAGASRAG
ncbi:MAG: hypothetical protein AB7O24_20450 [Kofleriaceae bacterium]